MYHRYNIDKLYTCFSPEIKAYVSQFSCLSLGYRKKEYQFRYGRLTSDDCASKVESPKMFKPCEVQQE